MVKLEENMRIDQNPLTLLVEGTTIQTQCPKKLASVDFFSSHK